MKKEEFFEALEKRLSMIEDSERSDILEEYRQHISMKTEGGKISEEEAIADFGDVDMLADDILRAYHVRIGAAEKSSSEERLRGIKEGFGRAGHSVSGFFSRCGQRIAAFFRGLGARVRGLFGRFCKKEKEEKVSVPAVCRQKAEGERFGARLARWIGRLWRWVCRWTRRLFFGCLCGVTGVMTACGLIAFGVLLVLAAQGYPLRGALILALGMLMCSGAVTVVFADRINRKKIGKGEENDG